MKINMTLNPDYNKMLNDKTENEKNFNTPCSDTRNVVIKRSNDRITLSDKANEYLKGKSKLLVSSGSDILETNENEEQNKISVYFGDSAILKRTVKRGYIELNNKKIILSDDIKEKLTQTDKIAQKARESAFANYNNDVIAKQHSELLKDDIDKDITAFSISAKMSKGSIVSAKEESLLLKSDPEMYLMSTIAQHMAKSQKKEYNEIKENNKVQNSDTPREFTSYKVKFDFDKSSESIINDSVDIESITITI